MFRASILTAAVCFPCSASAQEEPPKLERAFRDDFDKDTRGNYTITGGATWGRGKLTLAEGASVERSVEGGTWASIDLVLEPTGIRSGPLCVWFLLDGATNCFVELGGDSGDHARRLRIADTRDTEGRLETVTIRAISSRQTPRQLTLEYRYGLVRVLLDDRPTLLGHIANESATVAGVRLVGPGTVRAIGVRTSPRPRSLSSQERERRARALREEQQARALQREGDLIAARKRAEEAVRLRGLVHGVGHPSYAGALHTLAMIVEELGEYAEYERLQRRIIRIRAVAYGEHHPWYAGSLNNLAMAHYYRDEYPEAVSLFETTLRKLEAVHGRSHATPAAVRDNLAGLYHRMGLYEKAEPLFRKSSADLSRLQGKDRADYATSLNNLAVLYSDMGDYDQAIKHHQMALNIRTDVFPENHPHRAISLHNLADIYYRVGRFRDSETLHREALEIAESLYGNGHLQTAASLHSLGMLYLEQDRFEKAEQFIRNALEVKRRGLGDKHPGYIATLNNLAALLTETGDLDQAKTLYEQTVSASRTVQGREHPFYARALHNLGRHESLVGNRRVAVRAAGEAAAIVRRHLDRTSVVQSERQQKRMQARNRTFLDVQVALTTDQTVRDTLESVWLWKGAVTRRQRAYRLLAADTEASPLFDALRTVSRKLSVLSNAAPIPPPASAPIEVRDGYETKRGQWKAQFETLNQERETIEKSLASIRPEFQAATEPLTVEQLRRLLPVGTALIDIIQYSPGPDVRTEAEPGEAGPRYAAFVVRRTREPVMVRLGSVEGIATALAAVRRGLVERGPAETSSAFRQLRDLLWLPLEEHLHIVDTVIVCPDTALGTFPFAVLPGRRPGTFLLEDYRLASTPSASHLRSILSQRTSPPAGAKLLAVGDVDYDSDQRPAARPDDGQLLALANDQEGLRRVRGDNGAGWTSLPGFRAELEAVRSLHSRGFGPESHVTTLSGSIANEEEFLQQAGQHDTLHVITHGFFANPDVRSIQQAALKSELLGSAQRADPFYRTWLPGLLSGLAMAGANNPPTDPASLNDGILRSSEIESSSLQGVDLVVLSACETGLGAVAGGEGLTGLQRAFHIAGVRSVVASFWKVDDRATQELMRQFYTNLWIKKQSKIDALRNAQLWMLNNPAKLAALGVKEPRTRGDVRERTQPAAGQKPLDRTSPYFWAAFTLSGDWR